MGVIFFWGGDNPNPGGEEISKLEKNLHAAGNTKECMTIRLNTDKNKDKNKILLRACFSNKYNPGFINNQS